MQRADSGVCAMLIRDNSALPGGSWSWKFYVDGNVQHRAPGSTRKDAVKLYCLLKRGPHRIVVRESDVSKPDRVESNTLHFDVHDHEQVIISVRFENGRPVLEVEDESLRTDV